MILNTFSQGFFRLCCILLLTIIISVSTTQTKDNDTASPTDILLTHLRQMNINLTGNFSKIYPFIKPDLTEYAPKSVSVFPSKPQNMEIRYIEPRKILFKWSIDQASLTSLEGFGLQIICNYGLCNISRILNITLVPVNQEQTEFHLVLPLNFGSTDFLFYSLPYKSTCESMERRTVILLLDPVFGLGSNDTTPCLIFGQRKNLLELNFGTDLNSSSTDKYEVCLENDKNDSFCKKMEEFPLKFSPIIDGKYGIKVKAVDILENEVEANCTNCDVEETGYVTYTTFCFPTRVEEYLYPLLGGVMIGIFTIYILVLSLKIHKLKINKFQKKTILLLHTGDISLESMAIDKFIKCLQMFRIHVQRPNMLMEQINLSWFLNIFDNILLLDSIALGQRQDSWASGKDYSQFLKEEHSRDLTKNLFAAINALHEPRQENRFLRCKWNFVPEEFEFKNYPSDSTSYVIPDDLHLLIEKIHGSVVDTSVCRDQIKDLKNSILLEAIHIAENPNWFQERYGVPITMESEEVIINSNRILQVNDEVSHVSSKVADINKKTDKELIIQEVALSGLDEMSV